MEKGIGASPGIGIGKVLVVAEQKPQVERTALAKEAVQEEILRFNRAIEESAAQLDHILTESIGSQNQALSEIMEAHVVILRDPVFHQEVAQLIEDQQVGAPYAVQQIIQEKVVLFQSLDDPYFRERANDIQDIGNRIIRNLLNLPDQDLTRLTENVILTAEELTPSQMATLDRVHVRGIVTETGGFTGHTAIMARNLSIPAVMGIKGITGKANTGETLIIDGEAGLVMLDPTLEQQEQYQARYKREQEDRKKLAELKTADSITLDGKKVALYANIGNGEEALTAMENGAEGVGLFRTEFLFMDRNNVPSEEEQFESYRKAVEAMAGRAVIIRTLDIGGDKPIPYLNLPKEENPFLGYRAIRICLEDQGLFKTQLRAILRASVYGKARIMYPMISSVKEVRQANQVLAQAKEELAEAGIAFDPHIQVGIMIEIPSAAVAADLLIKEVDFFSIGTNDLTQYTLAVDRMNQQVSYLYNSFEPAVLRLIQRVIQVAHEYGKEAAMCGEMAGTPHAVPLLLGMGLDEFSMGPASILKIRRLVRSLRFEAVQELVKQVMALEEGEQIEAFLKEWTQKQLKEVSP